MKCLPLMVAATVLLSTSLPAMALSDASLPVSVGKSEVVTVANDVTKVSVTDPAIADVAVLSKRDVLINGKKPGTTNLIVWTKKNRITYDVVVRVDAGLLKATIQKATGAKDLQVEVVNDSVLLYGKVDRTSQAQMAEKLASGFAPHVVNLLAPDAVQQVQVDVEVVEMNKGGGSELGIKWGQMLRTANGEDFFEADHLTTLQSDPRNPRNTQPGSALVSGGGTAFGLYERIAARLNLMVQNGTARVLAKPNLVAISGGKAEFLAGGEIPLPISQQQGQVTFDWKPYGIKLQIEPVVLEDGRISMKVAPEVSQLDYTNAVRVANFVVPAVSSRRAETQLILKEGQGLAIGGLIQNSETQTVEQVPLLGSIPILGELFKSTKFQHNETELTILVTPHLVQSK
ncbi:MAG TPA: type II and III secretion system protein family protein [Stenomitos sp.]